MSKTQIAILWGLAVVIVVVFAVLGLTLSRPRQEMMAEIRDTPAQTYSLPEIPQTARRFYARAEQAAQSWQSDARLVSAVASWSFVRLDRFSEPIGWIYQFYSATTNRTYVVSVDEAQVVPLKEAVSPYPLAVVADQDWRMDSHEALNTWLGHGGDDLLRRKPVVDVSAGLRQAQSGQLEWVVVGVARDDQTFQAVRIDASSGRVIE